MTPRLNAQLPSVLTCSGSGGIAPTTRGEGLSELGGDVVFACSGDLRPPSLSSFNVELNTLVTSAITDAASGTTDALLLVNEPAVPVVGENAFFGKLSNDGFTLSFTDVPIPPTPEIVYRITNIRYAGAPAGITNDLNHPAQITGRAWIVASQNVPMTSPTTVIGYSRRGMQPGRNPVAPGPTPGQTLFPVTFTETNPIAFRIRLAPGQDPSVPGGYYGSESGFVNSAVLSGAGFATTATRFLVRVTNVPAGVNVFAPVSSVEGGDQLMSADSTGTGGTPITGQPRAGGNYQQIAVSGGTGTATWEVTSSSLFEVETRTFQLLVEAPVGADLGRIGFKANLAPISDLSGASESAQRPRFIRRSDGDFDGNGTPDLIWLNDTSRETMAWLMGSAGFLYRIGQRPLSSPGVPGQSIVGTGDFNGDGRTDVVWQDDASTLATVWYMGGPKGVTSGGTETIFGARLPGWHIAAVADFNQDGHPDLLWVSDALSQAYVVLLSGLKGTTPTGTAWLTSKGLPGWRVAAAADMDGDGAVDVIWQNTTSQDAMIWYLTGPNGTTVRDKVALPQSMPGWRIAGASDLDGNGTPDLVWVNDSTRQALAWMMGGTGGATRLAINWITAQGLPGWTLAVPR